MYLKILSQLFSPTLTSIKNRNASVEGDNYFLILEIPVTFPFQGAVRTFSVTL